MTTSIALLMRLQACTATAPEARRKETQLQPVLDLLNVQYIPLRNTESVGET